MAGFSNPEEPHVVAPLPFPYPLTEVSESPQLDLTPEKGCKKRKSIVPPARQTTLLPTPTDDCNDISTPKLNSTVQLYKQLQILRSEWQNSRKDGEQFCAISRSASRPLRELNVAKSSRRYSELPSIDVSNESFQKLTTVRRKNFIPSPKRDVAEPNIMDFFDQSMEWEEADWNQDIAPTPLGTVRSNTSCLLYDHLHAKS